MKLGLGTAQFGMSYGISNRRGKIPTPEAHAILALATKSGIELLDTAAAYGDSENIIGQAPTDVKSFRIVTKAPALRTTRVTRASAGSIKHNLEQSLSNLRRSSVYGYLLHDPDDLLAEGAEWLIEVLNELKQERLVEKIGVSVYSAAEIEQVLDVLVPDLVQLPVSLFDQRLLRSGHLAELKRRGVEVHARSIFLQGLLLMRVEETPTFCSPILPKLERFAQFVDELGLTRLEVALAFIRQIDEIDAAVVGVSDIDELSEILMAINRNAAGDIRIDNAPVWAVDDALILDPSRWPKEPRNSRL